MTVVDTSVIVDHLLGGRRTPEFSHLLRREGEVVAPDVLVFETLAAIRRIALRGDLDESRGRAAVAGLGLLPLHLLPTLPLRGRAWALRRNLAVGDALFVASAEAVGEPLLTLDPKLAAAAQSNSRAEVRLVG